MKYEEMRLNSGLVDQAIPDRLFLQSSLLAALLNHAS